MKKISAVVVVLVVVLLGFMAHAEGSDSPVTKMVKIVSMCKQLDGNTTRAQAQKSVFHQVGGRSLPGFRNFYVSDVTTTNTMMAVLESDVFALLSKEQMVTVAEDFRDLIEQWRIQGEFKEVYLFLLQAGETVPRAFVTREKATVFF